MKILIIGAGGVGGYFGAALIQSGADVSFLLRGKRYDSIKENGLTIETAMESYTVFPKVVAAAELKPIYDLIILTPKAYDLDGVLESLTNGIARGVFLPLLNGMSHYHQLDELFGVNRVMGGTANIVSTITEQGSVMRLTDMQLLTIGHRSTSHELLARDFFQLCQSALFDSTYSENINQGIWDKWIFLSSLAALTTVFRASIGGIVAAPYGKELVLSVLSEACDIASRSGFPIDPLVQKKAFINLTKVDSPLTASMLRDFQAGARTEHKHILGDLILAGVKAGVKCDLLKMTFANLCINSK